MGMESKNRRELALMQVEKSYKASGISVRLTLQGR